MTPLSSDLAGRILGEVGRNKANLEGLGHLESRRMRLMEEVAEIDDKKASLYAEIHAGELRLEMLRDQAVELSGDDDVELVIKDGGVYLATSTPRCGESDD